MTKLSVEVDPDRLRQADGRTQLALRWYERAQAIDSLDDRYLALWIALEALAGGPGTDLLKRLWELVVAALGEPTSRNPQMIATARDRVDVRALRDLRNRIIVGTGRELAPSNVEFTVSSSTLATVDAVVEDTLRHRLSLPPSHSLVRAIEAPPRQ